MTTIHTLPLNDIREHKEGMDCPCRPLVQPYEGEGDYTYHVIHNSFDGREAGEPDAISITCPVCGMTSYNWNDVRYGYCGNCCKFTGEPRDLSLP